MRPINLIPPEQRRGEHAPLRSGPLAYILLGALVAVLAGVTALVLTGNQVAEREAEVTRLEAEDAVAKAEAERLAVYVQFRNLSEARRTTVASLAESRFDWERVMRELALVLPSDAWLVELTASASTIGVEGGSGGGGLRGSIPGPALELSGCATGQEAVAGFVTALKDIDGVTRVGVESSKLPEKDTSSQDGGNPGEGSSDECRTRKFIAKFEIVVAFDAAPVPLDASAEGPPPAPASEEKAGDTAAQASNDSGESGGAGEAGEGG